MVIHNYYEELSNMDIDNNNRLLFYAIMYRRWDEVSRIAQKLQITWSDIKDKLFDETNVTVEDCVKLNLDFLKDSKNEQPYVELCNCWGEEFRDLSNDLDFYTYDDKRFQSGKSAFDIFWKGNQPVLSLYYLEKQTMPARQVMNKGCSMVLDEVGTGKTVAGIFTIQQVIQENINKRRNGATDDVDILVVCPYNKREDWYSDILRQLGRESEIIDQGENGENIFKKSTKRGIPHIYISGNKGGKKDDSSQQLKYSLKDKTWDLVIIDECHSCFDNYHEIRAERALLLTATPIVVSGGEVRSFKEYEALLNNILGGNTFVRKVEDGAICPKNKSEYSDEDIFTCNFKEDLFSKIKINRDIHFIDCKRNENRQNWFYKLRYEKDFFSAIFADQDDNRLVEKMKQIFPDNAYPVISENGKINKLKEIIGGNSEGFGHFKGDSFIIFCETTDTVDFIFDSISGEASDELMIGKLHGEIAEIKNCFTNKDIIMSMLKKHIRNGKRSILITTGKSGGTGLNLGEFNTVIHYELPFSSNELEQRFGRIERADDLLALSAKDDTDKKEIRNKMVFLMNEPVDRESDFETNRMLYYAINKINITVNHMPIRNTVLFHPDYIRRVQNSASGIWKGVMEAFDNEDIVENINQCCKYYNDLDEIEELGCIKEIKEKMSVVDKVESILNNKNGESLNENDVEKLRKFRNEYAGNYRALEEEKQEIDKFIEYYLWLGETISLWEPDHIESDMEKGYFDATAEKTTDESDIEDTGDLAQIDDKKNKENSEKLDKQIADVFDKIRKFSDGERCVIIKEHINKMIDRVKQVGRNNEYSGVFYRKDGRIVNKRFDSGEGK